MSHYAQLVVELTILVLAIFLGIEVISKVPTLLHTPLMSGTNAIHGIVIVGAMLVAGIAGADTLTGWVGFVAMILAAANVVGGFVVTDRMLEMFKKREPPKRDRTTRLMARATTSNLLYLVTIICFILALRFLSSPTTARRGQLDRRRRGWSVAIVGHARASRRAHRLADPRRRRDRRRLRCRRRAPREDDRDAADGGAVQRRRRRRGGARLARRVPQPRPRARPAARRHLDRDRRSRR